MRLSHPYGGMTKFVDDIVVFVKEEKKSPPTEHEPVTRSVGGMSIPICANAFLFVSGEDDNSVLCLSIFG